MIITCNHNIIAITAANNILTSNFMPRIAAVAAGNMLISSSLLSIAMVLLLPLLLLIHVTKLLLQHSVLLIADLLIEFDPRGHGNAAAAGGAITA